MLSEFPYLKEEFWVKYFCARGYPTVSSGNIADEMIQQYIQEQGGKPLTGDNRFEITLPLNFPDL